MCGEFQLGRRNLYPDVGGTLNQSSHLENKFGNHKRQFNFSDEVNLTKYI